jgi:hypothetical protein
MDQRNAWGRFRGYLIITAKLDKEVRVMHTVG